MRSLGFDHVIDYTREGFAQTDGCYDLIIDNKTDKSLFRCLRALTPAGTCVVLGGTGAGILQTLLSGSLYSLFLCKKSQVLMLKPDKGPDYMSALLECGKLHSVIDGPYALETIREAFQLYRKGKHRGKIVVEVCR